jgi:hypothetical protein
VTTVAEELLFGEPKINGFKGSDGERDLKPDGTAGWKSAEGSAESTFFDAPTFTMLVAHGSDDRGKEPRDDRNTGQDSSCGGSGKMGDQRSAVTSRGGATTTPLSGSSGDFAFPARTSLCAEESSNLCEFPGSTLDEFALKGDW